MKPSTTSLLGLVVLSGLGCRIGFEEHQPDSGVFRDSGFDSDTTPFPDGGPDAIAEPDGGAPTILGHWIQIPGARDFGDMWFAEVDGQIRGVYDFEDGRVVGTLAGNTLDGWEFR